LGPGEAEFCKRERFWPGAAAAAATISL